MIYLPDNITNTNCAYVYNSETIRVYDEVPRPNSTISYKDYYVNSHYIYRTGQTTWSNYNTFNDTCLSSSNFTTNAFYRNT